MNDPFQILLQPAGKKDPHSATLKLVETSGPYRIGPPVRPNTKYDNGFLDKFPRREPGPSDYARLEKWKSILWYAEHYRKDLIDATGAYRHFLYGKGADRKVIDYEKYLRDDPAATDLIVNLINDLRTHVEIIGKNRIKFAVTSEMYHVGRGGISRSPLTENWLKTIGMHNLWVSADVVASADAVGKIWYEADLKINMEDRYNFNPGQSDVDTGIPDSDNGVLEITGLATQYMNFSASPVFRHTKWVEGEREEPCNCDEARMKPVAKRRGSERVEKVAVRK